MSGSPSPYSEAGLYSELGLKWGKPRLRARFSTTELSHYPKKNHNQYWRYMWNYKLQQTVPALIEMMSDHQTLVLAT